MEHKTRHAVIAHANTSNGIKIPTFVGKSWGMMLYLSSASLRHFSCILGVILWGNTLLSHSLSPYPCERILISPDNQTWWSSCNVFNARVCDSICLFVRLFGILRENVLDAHDITYMGHYEKLLCTDNDSRCHLRKMKIISSAWIALLRKLLIWWQIFEY